MITQNKLFLCIITISLMLASCTKDFKEINTDPNRIDQVSPGTLLNPIIYEVAAFNMNNGASGITFDLMQVMLPFPSPQGGLHRYEITENTGSSTWNTYYRWLKNIKEMHEASVKAQDPNYQAIAMTLNAWVASNLTDVFGDVPYSEAVRGDEQLFFPKFDKQEEIYKKLISDLEEANKLYNTTRPMLYGTDILFANNITRWKKFTNSLHMRLLLRISNTNPDVFTLLRNMLNNSTQYPVFVSNAEAAVLNITGVTPLVSPWGRPIDLPLFRAAGKFFVDSLNAVNDPRRAKFMSQARSNAAGTPLIGFVGIPSGYTGPETQFNFTPSNFLAALATAPMIVPVLPYAEVEFIRAEVEWRAGNSAAAKAAYEKGVKAAIEQWSVPMPADYFTNSFAAYNGTLERIMLQKYYALIFVDFQQWSEYRRTRLPKLPVGAGMVNNGVMPSRLEYPISVRISNPEKYKQAVTEMGGDNINIKLWWAK
ncbi:MAG TPA: SusD/RagB family nutrient-binding outer membrane lipoprotein [Flavisolibacter sp.]|nr:SusD/RagB family nutrient-binding outer membrane lipoprotein [Flavisolibacter sp.]